MPVCLSPLPAIAKEPLAASERHISCKTHLGRVLLVLTHTLPDWGSPDRLRLFQHPHWPCQGSLHADRNTRHSAWSGAEATTMIEHPTYIIVA